MDPLTMALISGGIGLAKSEFIDKPNETKDRIMAATTARYSPWTKMQPQDVQRTNPLGEAMAWGAQGAALGQNMETADADRKLKAMLAEKTARQIRTPEERAAGVVETSDTGTESDVVAALRKALQDRKAYA